jgi:hypothetical protein
MEIEQDTEEGEGQNTGRTARFLFVLGFLLVATMLIVPCVVLSTSALFDTGVGLLFQ